MKLIRNSSEGNKTSQKNYIELTPGTPVWVQHRQNTSLEPATVMSQCTTNLCWIMQKNGTEQPKVYMLCHQDREGSQGGTRHSLPLVRRWGGGDGSAWAITA